MIIFTFHHVEPSITRPSRRHISLLQKDFKNLVLSLPKLGFTVLGMKDVLDIADPGAFDDRHVLLTFDDGYQNFYDYAAPVLEETQTPATVFVVSGRYGEANVWDYEIDPECDKDRLMTEQQIQEVAQSQYITVGSHGLKHQHFGQVDDAALHSEITQSYNNLDALLGPNFSPVLAYPWGEYDPRTLELMEKSPYQYGFTVDKGPWRVGQARYTLPRYSIYYRDGNPITFRLKLWRNGILR